MPHLFTILMFMLPVNRITEVFFCLVTVANPLDDIVDGIYRDFLEEYTKVWPHPHQIHYNVGQMINVELNGAQQRGEVRTVDCSLIEVFFKVSTCKCLLTISRWILILKKLFTFCKLICVHWLIAVCVSSCLEWSTDGVDLPRRCTLGTHVCFEEEIGVEKGGEERWTRGENR